MLHLFAVTAEYVHPYFSHSDWERATVEFRTAPSASTATVNDTAMRRAMALFPNATRWEVEPLRQPSA
jgi:hypothetical protein